MKTSHALTEFITTVQRYYICYACSSIGLSEFANNMALNAPDRTKNMYVANAPPEEKFQGKMNIGEFLDSSQKNGVYSDITAKAFITSIYSLWDELYRYEMAKEIGVKKNAVKCDLMGDLRLIRNCIVHNKSVITNEEKRLKELEWELSPGPLNITEDLFITLIDQINKMKVKV